MKAYRKRTTNTERTAADLFTIEETVAEDTQVLVNLSIEAKEYVFDSDEERYFSWWLDELKAMGFIQEYFRPQTLSLSPSDTYQLLVKANTLKGKDKVVERELIKEHVYTGDYKVIWTALAHGIFYEPITEVIKNNDVLFFAHFDDKIQEYYSLIEVKPEFDRNNMTREFTINKKWVYDNYGLYFELVKVPEIFRKTFTPGKYLFTDKKKQLKKLDYKPIEIDEYLKRLGYGTFFS